MRADKPIVPATGATAVIIRFRRFREPRTIRRTRGVAGLIKLWRRRWVERREMRDLALFQPDSVLLDAGVSREEAWRRSRKPFWRP